MSVQAKVLELFKKLQAEIGFACLFITHDLAVVDMLADHIMVMHKGQIVEHGDADQIMQNPQEPIHAEADWLPAGARSARTAQASRASA